MALDSASDSYTDNVEGKNEGKCIMWKDARKAEL